MNWFSDILAKYATAFSKKQGMEDEVYFSAINDVS